MEKCFHILVLPNDLKLCLVHSALLYPSARLIPSISTAMTRGGHFALVNAVEALVMKAGEFRQSVFLFFLFFSFVKCEW